jgi:restriction system protein
MMQIISKLSEDKISKFLQEFYDYFKTGYEFEEFLKEYLLKMGLDEVEITQRSKDNGVDLKAIRKGVGDFSDIDITHYYVQAKRYSPQRKVNVTKIRELKGTIPFGYKGMMITTSDFTEDAVAESSNDQSKPVILINGKALIMSCIENEIGFVFKPIFSKRQMDLFLNKNHVKSSDNVVANEKASLNDAVEKKITANDIRSRIVSIPSSIMKQISEEISSVNIIVNNEKKYTFIIVRGRNYLGGVTKFLRDYNMLSDDNVIFPKLCKWIYNAEDKLIKLYIED